MQQLVAFLSEGDLLQLRWLAEKLAVSTATVIRDLDALRGMGYRIEGARGPGGGVALRK